MVDCKNCLHWEVCGYALNSKTVFLAREEAERVLEEGKNK